MRKQASRDIIVQRVLRRRETLRTARFTLGTGGVIYKERRARKLFFFSPSVTLMVTRRLSHSLRSACLRASDAALRRTDVQLVAEHSARAHSARLNAPLHGRMESAANSVWRKCFASCLRARNRRFGRNRRPRCRNLIRDIRVDEKQRAENIVAEKFARVIERDKRMYTKSYLRYNVLYIPISNVIERISVGAQNI